MRYISLFLFVLAGLSLHSQNQALETPKIDWMTMEQALTMQQAQPKIIMIDMYTDWCGWCKKMDATSFAHPGIVNYINRNFYSVKFDCESRDTIMYKDSAFVSSGPPSDARRKPAHNLAKYLLNGRLSYPSLVFIDESLAHYAIGGYRDALAIEPLLIYFAERIYKTANYADFEVNFNKTFHPVVDSVYPELQGKVNWISFDELPAAVEKESRKIMLNIYHETTRGSQVMSATTFTHPVIAEYINENYYAVSLNVLSQDSISFIGQEFGNQNQSPSYPHDLAIALLQPTITVPTTIFFDESFGLIYALRGYAAPSLFELYLAFIDDGLYNNGENAWAEFVKVYEKKIK